eukprot:6743560-Prymnesium_polylepis.1
MLIARPLALDPAFLNSIVGGAEKSGPSPPMLLCSTHADVRLMMTAGGDGGSDGGGGEGGCVGGQAGGFGDGD